jgi:hypothetical protein
VKRGELTQAQADKLIRYAEAHAFIDRYETLIIIPLDELASTQAKRIHTA